MTAQLMLLDLSYTTLQAAGAAVLAHLCSFHLQGKWCRSNGGAAPAAPIRMFQRSSDAYLRQCYEQMRQRSSLAPAMLAASLRDTPVLVSRPERYPRQLLARTPRCAMHASASAHVVNYLMSVRWVRLRNSSAEWYSLPTVLTTGEAECGPAGSAIVRTLLIAISRTAPGDCSRPSRSRVFKFAPLGRIHAPGAYSRPQALA